MRASFQVAFALLLLPSFLAAREYEHSIALKPGHREVTITGRLATPQDSALFTFTAHADQHISIRIKPVDRRLVIQAVLIHPSGKQDGPGTVLSSSADESGTYRIRITPREQSSGTFRLYLTVR